jgi:hypothetical protein
VTRRIGHGRWSATCQALVVLAAFLALAQRGAAAEEPLYPHAEREFGPWGYIDKTGRIVIPLQFDWAEPFSEGRAAVIFNNKVGFIDTAGRLVIDFQFDHLSTNVPPFRGGYAPVYDGKQWRLIDRDGAPFVIARAEAVPAPRAFGEDRVVFFVKGKGDTRMGAADVAGRVVIEPEYDLMGPFSDGLARVKRGDKYGFVDKDGRLAIAIQFDGAREFKGGRAQVFQKLTKPEEKRDKNGKYIMTVAALCGFIDRSGQLVVPYKFEVCNDFYEDRASVFVAGQGWGIIDMEGRFVIPPQMTTIASGGAGTHIFLRTNLTTKSSSKGPERSGFSEGVMAVSDAKSVGYIDRDGKVEIAHQFAIGSLFHGGLAVVSVRAEVGFGLPDSIRAYFMGVIDRSGQFVVPPVYDWAKLRLGGLVQVKFGDRLGYVDAAGGPLTFTRQELDEHVARKREELRPLAHPAAGRAVFAKAGDIEYYLRLPESLCALDDSQPADRTFIENVWAEQAKAQQTLSALKPSLKKDEARTKEMLDLAKSRDRFILPCDQLAGLRSGAGKQEIDSYIAATGLHTDHYDRSSLGGAFWGHALMCGLMPGDVFKRSKTGARDESGSVATAFERLRTGKPAVLRTMEMDYPAFCYHAFIIPPPEQGGSAPDLPLKAKLASSAYLSTKDWTVHLVTRAVAVASADDFWQCFERDRTLLRDIGKANPLE